mgnify:CR=1 FL=1
MKITVEFNSLEEMNDFTSRVWSTGANQEAKTETKKAVKEKKAPVVKEEPKEEVKKTPGEDTAQETPAESTPQEDVKYSFTDVRGVLAKLAKTDSTKVASILKDFGASKLSEIKEENYAAVIERAGA